MEEVREKAIKESVLHWEEMIEWAKKQKGKASIEEMQRDIKTAWKASDCSLCQEYVSWNGEEFVCTECPIAETGGGCHSANSAWSKVNFCIDLPWKKWVIAAEKMLELLKSLLGKELKSGEMEK